MTLINEGIHEGFKIWEADFVVAGLLRVGSEIELWLSNSYQ